MNNSSIHEKISMTALICLFARAYHSRRRGEKVFDDPLAGRLLTEEEYRTIGESMAGGISFFCPDFSGTEAEALEWTVAHDLAPTPLGRAAFIERSLENAVRTGARQLLILGAGYETFSFRQPPWGKALRIFEADRGGVLRDKKERLSRAGVAFPENLTFVETELSDPAWADALAALPAFGRQITFVSLPGLIYYLPKPVFAQVLSSLSALLPRGSALAFDCPAPVKGERAEKQAMLAGAAGEGMKAAYAYEELESLLSSQGFLIYEYLTPGEITPAFFSAYNRENPRFPMKAVENVNFCLAVKR